MRKYKKLRSNNGFTLVELIVVIVILAILIGVSIGGIYSWVNKARQNTDIKNTDTIEKALNEQLLGEKFPSVGIAYALCCVSETNKKESESNFFVKSFVLGADGEEGAFQNNNSGVTLSNGKIVDKSLFQNKIIKCLGLDDSSDTTRILKTNATDYYNVIVVAVDEYGNFLGSKCVLYDFKGCDSDYFVPSRGLVAYYFNDYFNDRLTFEGSLGRNKTRYASDNIDLALKYVMYDGNINKFE